MRDRDKAVEAVGQDGSVGESRTGRWMELDFPLGERERERETGVPLVILNTVPPSVQ